MIQFNPLWVAPSMRNAVELPCQCRSLYRQPRSSAPCRISLMARRRPRVSSRYNPIGSASTRAKPAMSANSGGILVTATPSYFGAPHITHRILPHLCGLEAPFRVHDDHFSCSHIAGPRMGVWAQMASRLRLAWERTSIGPDAAHNIGPVAEVRLRAILLGLEAVIAGDGGRVWRRRLAV